MNAKVNSLVQFASIRSERLHHKRILLFVLVACCVIGQTSYGQNANWFNGKDLALQHAIDADSVTQLQDAVTGGANVNASGRVHVTPLEYAVGHFANATYAALLKLGANPNQKDDEGDNAMTLAVRAYAKDPQYLVLALDAHGDPNTLQPDKDPILMAFRGTDNLDAMRLLAKHGANLNVKSRIGYPMVYNMALSNDWDAVWMMLQLGAAYKFDNPQLHWKDVFADPAVGADGTLALYITKSWQFLTAHGVHLPPLHLRR